MLFDFQEFIKELKESGDKEKIEMLNKYEEYFGVIQGGIKDQIWYTDYLSKFTFQPYKTPEDLDDTDFDWDILQKLVIGSFSSEYEFKKEGEEGEGFELYIAVKNGEQSIVKTVSELRSHQIMRLYKIYIEEEMSLQVLLHGDDNNEEKVALLGEREVRLRKWNAVIDTMGREEEKKEAEKNQEDQLQNLMGQL
jgi:L-rhamnose mutarotase